MIFFPNGRACSFKTKLFFSLGKLLIRCPALSYLQVLGHYTVSSAFYSSLSSNLQLQTLLDPWSPRRLCWFMNRITLHSTADSYMTIILSSSQDFLSPSPSLSPFLHYKSFTSSIVLKVKWNPTSPLLCPLDPLLLYSNPVHSGYFLVYHSELCVCLQGRPRTFLIVACNVNKPIKSFGQNWSKWWICHLVHLLKSARWTRNQLLLPHFWESSL